MKLNAMIKSTIFYAFVSQVLKESTATSTLLNALPILARKVLVLKLYRINSFANAMQAGKAFYAI